jgi:ribose 5-phosphate isomerase B
MKVIIGSDHAGYQMKEKVIAHLHERGVEVEDVGTHGEESVDYTDFGRKVASKVSDATFDRGILMCGTGLGMSMVANLVMGGRLIGDTLALQLVDTWLDTPFEGGRHQRRLEKMDVE